MDFVMNLSFFWSSQNNGEFVHLSFDESFVTSMQHLCRLLMIFEEYFWMSLSSLIL